MARQYEEINDAISAFIDRQHIFFVATAAETGRVNLSPKGMDSLRILSPIRLIWRNLSGSGNESAGHLARVNRMTLMWCGFDAQPMILRVYGSARALHPSDAGFDAFNAEFPPDPGARQIFDLSIDLVQTSCGYAVPFFDYTGDRDVLADWSVRKGPAGIRATWARDNLETIDGFPTGILDQ